MRAKREFSEADRTAAFEHAQQKIAQAKVEHGQFLNPNSIGPNCKPRALTTLPPVKPVR